MKKKLVVSILIVVGVSLIIAAVAMHFMDLNNDSKSKNNKLVERSYGDVNKNLTGESSFMEKDGKAYVEWSYENTGSEMVLLKSVSLKVFKAGTEEVLYKEDVKPNREIDVKKKGSIKFKALDKSLSDMKEYYPEVTFK